jgi:formate dehydrogenase major subunit
MLNAMLNVIVTEKLYDQQYIQTYVEGFGPFPKPSRISPRRNGADLRHPADTLREVARAYARAESAITSGAWAVSHHTHGTDNARCLIALSLIYRADRPSGHWPAPCAARTTCRGASDAGLIPMFFPDYKSVENPEIRGKVESLWNTKLDPKRGLTVVEIMDAVHADVIKGMYILGENPAMSDPDLNHAREALAHLEHLVVQDLFLTETAVYADVFLPASAWPEKDGTVTNTNRQVQMGRQALPLPGDAKSDWWITQELARRIGSQLELQAPRRNLYGDGLTDALARQHPVGSRRARKRSDLSADAPTSRAATWCSTRAFRAPVASAKLVASQTAAAGRDAGPRVSVHPHHRPPARALAHRRDDRARTVLDALEPRRSRACRAARSAKLGIKPGDMVA